MKFLVKYDDEMLLLSVYAIDSSMRKVHYVWLKLFDM